MLRSTVAYLGSPLVGVIAGAIAMSFVVGEPAAMLSIAYAAFGSLLAVAASLLVGIPAVFLFRRAGKPLLPWLLLPAVCAALLLVFAVQCALAPSHCASLPPLHNFVFAVVSSVVTALFIGVCSRGSAL